MANENRDPRAYELMSVLIPDMPEEDTKAAIDRINGYITDEGGTIKDSITDSPWGRRRLAYTMRFNNVDYRDGYYVLTHFSAEPNANFEIERDLKLDNQVIRYLLVIDDPKAGEKDTGQNAEGEQEAAPEASADEKPAATDQAAAEQEPAPAATDQTHGSAAATKGDAEAAPAPAQEQQAEPAPETTASAEDTASDVADEIQGEENPAPADAPVATKRTASTKLPGEGEGTHWIAGDGTDNMPEGFVIKGNASSKIYHPAESPNYNNTIAEIYFATPEAAEAAGYRLPKSLQHAVEAAAEAVTEIVNEVENAASEEK